MGLESVPPLHFALVEESSWTLIFVISQILFWCYGFVTAIEFGYSDLMWDDEGCIKSGPSGSGVVIVSGIMAFAILFMYVKKGIAYALRPSDEEEEE